MKMQHLRMLCQPRKKNVEREVQEDCSNDDPQAKGEDDHQQSTDHAQHHQREQRDGQPVNERLLPNVSIDLVAFH